MTNRAAHLITQEYRWDMRNMGQRYWYRELARLHRERKGATPGYISIINAQQGVLVALLEKSYV